MSRSVEIIVSVLIQHVFRACMIGFFYDVRNIDSGPYLGINRPGASTKKNALLKKCN